MSKSKLLIVDDKPENLLVLEALLGANYHLIPAHSGPEALRLLEEQAVDLVLLDIQMPVMDGFETAQRIKKIEHCKNTPIILISAVYTEDPYVRKGYESGAVDFFAKPFDPELLKLKVALYASSRQKDALIHQKDERIRELEGLLNSRP